MTTIIILYVLIGALFGVIRYPILRSDRGIDYTEYVLGWIIFSLIMILLWPFAVGGHLIDYAKGR